MSVVPRSAVERKIVIRFVRFAMSFLQRCFPE